MLYAKKSRWWPVALLAGFLITLALPLLNAVPAYAADASWTDPSHISYSGATFTENKISGNTMTLDVPGSQCSQIMKVGSGATSYKTATTAQVTTYQAVAGPHDTFRCTNPKTITITLSNTFNSVGGGGGNSNSQTPQIQCTILSFNPLNWFMCPLVDLAQSAVNTLSSVIDGMLTVDTTGPNSMFGNNPTGNGFKSAWSTFRLFALGLIIIAGLIMLIAQGLSLDFIDAYTIRKVLPRMVLMIIFISLSWYILQFLIGLSNDVGNGIRFIIYQPFQHIKGDVNVGNGATSVGFVVGAAGIAVLGLLGLLSFVLIAFLALLVGFVILIVRKIIIIMLVITAPLAFACYILPNTERAWKFWKDTLTSMLVVFPIISAMIAAGRVFAVVTYNSPGNATVNQITAFIAYFLPYFMLPMAFRLAGGAMAAVHGALHQRAAGGYAGLHKMRQNRMAQNMHELGSGNRFKSSNPVARRFNAATRNAANLSNAGVVPWKMRSRMQAASATHEQGEMAEYMEKNAAFGAIKGNDDYLQATMKNMGGGSKESDWRQYLSEHGYEGRSLEQGVAAIRAAKRGTSDEVFEKAAVMANATTGTGWKEGGFAQMAESINEVTGGDRHQAATMLAQMRGMATQSGRLDLAGAGFGTSVGAMNAMYETQARGYDEHDERYVDAKKANKMVAKGAIFTKDPGQYARARGQAVQNLAPHMLDQLKEAHQAVNLAHASGDSDQIYKAERTLAQEYASLDNIHTNLAHAAPENARIIADSVLSKAVGTRQDGTAFTVMDQINAYQRGDPNSVGTRAFLETTKTYGSGFEEERSAPREEE